MAETKSPLNVKTLGTMLEKEIEARSAKFWSDQVLATHQKDKTLSITQYINAQEIENTLERIISQLGGDALEQGMVLVSVTDKNGDFVTSDDNCDKIIVSVAFGQEFIIKGREFPPEENSDETTESSPDLKPTGANVPGVESTQPVALPKSINRPDGKPAAKADLNNNLLKAKRIQLAKELKRKLDALWINRKGLGINFNNPGALKIELVEDSPRINKIVQELGEEKLVIRIDQQSGLIKVYYGDKIYLKWKFPEE